MECHRAAVAVDCGAHMATVAGCLMVGQAAREEGLVSGICHILDRHPHYQWAHVER